jgi:hypothetical protein
MNMTLVCVYMCVCKRRRERGDQEEEKAAAQ